MDEPSGAYFTPISAVVGEKASDPPGTAPAHDVVNIFAEYVPPSYDHLSFPAEANDLFDETYADRDLRAGICERLAPPGAGPLLQVRRRRALLSVPEASRPPARPLPQSETYALQRALTAGQA